ncbi:transposase [Paraglaciecola sp.]|uniref:REP-associated tyrosine transposase n=1 Tax=Paraglaciecola sp. TaxID=1920173 RepID=UPI0030F46372
MSFHAKDLRKGRTSKTNAIYSITTVTYERQRIFNDFKSARLLIQTLQQSQHDQQTETIGFVVMPDHLHWMFSLNQNIKLSVLMMTIKGRSARNINLLRTTSDPVWQSGYYDHCLRNDEDLRKNMRYIVANPLRAGIVSSLKLYPHWDCIYL